MLELLNVVVAGAACWAFGALWYMLISKPWMQAAGLTEEQVRSASPAIYVISLVGAVLVAGMMRHVLSSGGITGIGAALVTGLGTGAFIVSPWIVNNVLYGLRDRRLIWMDCGYPILGMGIMCVVLVLF